MHYDAYLKSASQLIRLYNGDEPFSTFLKKYFSANKKFGSRDRKQVSHLCYGYFRLGKSLPTLPIEERILAGQLFISTQSNEYLAALKPGWNEKSGGSFEEKCSLFIPNSALNVFPWQNELSEGIDYNKFSRSHFIQPDLFLRIRPGREKIVQQKLHAADIPFTSITGNCIALANSSKVDTVLELNRDAVVQDYSSQQTGLLVQSKFKMQNSKVKSPVRPGHPGGQESKVTTWDCCAGSGGKSIMLFDLIPQVSLTVSDIRESILANLKKRFKEAGITNYKSNVIDLSRSTIDDSRFGLILADVPCTGSGTWSRTPEQLFYFNESKIAEYAALQKKIVSNAIRALKPGGYFFYITCSVFRKENEENVEFLKQNFHLNLINMEVLKGYDKKADTMFAALLQMPL